MKKYVLIILLLSATFSFSQMCASDEMLKYQIVQDPKLKVILILYQK